MMKGRWPWIAVAAALLLALGVLIVYSPPLQDLNVTVSPGANRVIELEDGSTVTLAPGTRFSTKFRNGARDVHVERGQAFFRVAPEKRRPFVVHARNRRITALGTAFDVRSRHRILRVAVVEGAVAIENKRSSVPDARLTAGNQITFNKGDDTPAPAAADPAEVMSWMNPAPRPR